MSSQLSESLGEGAARVRGENDGNSVCIRSWRKFRWKYGNAAANEVVGRQVARLHELVSQFIM